MTSSRGQKRGFGICLGCGERKKWIPYEVKGGGGGFTGGSLFIRRGGNHSALKRGLFPTNVGRGVPSLREGLPTGRLPGKRKPPLGGGKGKKNLSGPQPGGTISRREGGRTFSIVQKFLGKKKTYVPCDHPAKKSTSEKKSHQNGFEGKGLGLDRGEKRSALWKVVLGGGGREGGEKNILPKGGEKTHVTFEPLKTCIMGDRGRRSHQKATK